MGLTKEAQVSRCMHCLYFIYRLIYIGDDPEEEDFDNNSGEVMMMSQKRERERVINSDDEDAGESVDGHQILAIV